MQDLNYTDQQYSVWLVIGYLTDNFYTYISNYTKKDKYLTKNIHKTYRRLSRNFQRGGNMKKRERWRNCFRCTLKNCIHTSIKNKLMTFYFFFVFTSFLYSCLCYLKKGGGRLQPRPLHLKLSDPPPVICFCSLKANSQVV